MELVEPLVTLLLTDYTTDKQVQSLMSYLLQVGETNNLEALITTLASSVPKHEDTLMTIAEQLQAKGRQEGEAKGRQETLNEMARKMLLNGMDNQAIMAVTGLSVEELTLLSH